MNKYGDIPFDGVPWMNMGINLSKEYLIQPQHILLEDVGTLTQCQTVLNVQWICACRRPMDYCSDVDVKNCVDRKAGRRRETFLYCPLLLGVTTLFLPCTSTLAPANALPEEVVTTPLIFDVCWANAVILYKQAELANRFFYRESSKKLSNGPYGFFKLKINFWQERTF